MVEFGGHYIVVREIVALRRLLTLRFAICAPGDSRVASSATLRAEKTNFVLSDVIVVNSLFKCCPPTAHVPALSKSVHP
jgi:hypothetical protein